MNTVIGALQRLKRNDGSLCDDVFVVAFLACKQQRTQNHQEKQSYFES